jgi:hypothetical protein
MHTVPLDGRSPLRAVRLVITGAVGHSAALAGMALVAA